MSDFLTVGGVPVPVAPDGAELDWVETGDREAAFDGSPRASITARRRVLTVKTRPMLFADAATLRAALIASPTVPAAGDWIGATITVWPKLGKDTPVVTAGGFRVLMSFTLSES